MINNRHEKCEKLPSEIFLLHTPSKGMLYSHHPSIAFFKNKYYAAWSCGRVTEDDAGQFVMLSSSENGCDWSCPAPLITPSALGNPNGVITCAGLFDSGSTLNLYFGYYEYGTCSVKEGATRPEADAHHQNTTLFVMSTDDGISWSTPVDLKLAIVPNHPPEKTSSGRLIFPGNISFPHTDDKNGQSNIIVSGIYGSYFDSTPYCDDSDSIWKVGKHNGWVQQGMLVCEGSFYQTDDNVLHMLLRTNTDRLLCTESRDDGVTWCPPYKTDFETDAGKFHFGRLQDGRFYAVGNFSFNGYLRNPLHLCLSSDGESFSSFYVLRDEPHTVFCDDFRKGGLYGYPHSLVHNGYLYVIYSKHKEDIEITRVRLDDIK